MTASLPTLTSRATIAAQVRPTAQAAQAAQAAQTAQASQTAQAATIASPNVSAAPTHRPIEAGAPDSTDRLAGAALSSRALAVKRAIDVAGAVAGLVLLAPVFAAVALAILLVDGRPILFVQERIGLEGRAFRLVKFRTMVRDAEERYREVAPLSDTRGAGFKMRDDPRITRLGRWLRRSSLDELPQLSNVLRGEMSLVGPRPAPAREVVCYDPWHRARLSMKPGMTGVWQVASRFDEDFDQRAALDLEYIERWSLRADLVILLRTIPAVLLLTGR